MLVETVRDKTASQPLHAYTAICLNKKQNRAFLCIARQEGGQMADSKEENSDPKFLVVRKC